jgi:hypothetical protein
MFGFFKRKKQKPDEVPAPARLTLEDQLDVLQECGISLLPGVTVDHLLISWSRESYQETPFELTLVGCGDPIEEPPWNQWKSNNVWHFDTECIEGNGSYVAIAERMRDLSQGELPLTDIEDDIDEQFDDPEQRWQGTAWLAFTLDGERIRWEFEVDSDWVDSSVFTEFVELMERRHCSRRFTYLDLGGGQDCIIGCSTPDQFRMLREKTGLNFQWLS